MIIKNRVKGFTLIEVAIVIIIAGMVLVGLAGSYNVYVQMAQTKMVKSNLDTINVAIKDYLASRGRLPCPAPRNAAPDSPGFGLEAVPTCNVGGSVNGTILTSGIRIGAVPVRELKLPDQLAQDPWQKRYTYAVTATLATAGGYGSPPVGVIMLRDSNGNPIDAATHYVVFSHGKDGRGSFTNAGVATTGCATTATARDAENCIDNNTFVQTTLQSVESGPAHYDDYMVYAGTVSVAAPPAAGGVKRVQRGTIYIPGGGTPAGVTATATLAFPVNMEKSMTVWLGTMGSNFGAEMGTILQLTSPTIVRASKSYPQQRTDAVTVSFEVIEFY